MSKIKQLIRKEKPVPGPKPPARPPATGGMKAPGSDVAPGGVSCPGPGRPRRAVSRRKRDEHIV